MESVREEEGDDEESSGSEEEVSDEEDGSDNGEDETKETVDVNGKQQNLNAEAVQASSTPFYEASSSKPLSPSSDPNTLKFDDLEISDLSDTRLSRSPPESRRDLPERPISEEEEDPENEGGHQGDIKSIVASDITKKRAQQQRKYHSKRSIRSAGRSQGSKAKQSTKVKAGDYGGFWG